MNVYDFDNTIYRGESAVDLFWYYLKQDKSLLRYVPEVAAALVRYKRGKITIEEALSVYGARVADYFLTIPDFEADLKIFWCSRVRIVVFKVRKRGCMENTSSFLRSMPPKSGSGNAGGSGFPPRFFISLLQFFS